MSRAAIARPRLVLAVWMAACGLLALAGLSVEERLHRSDLGISGTAAAATQELARERFGTGQALTVTLTGSPARLDRTGPRLVAELGRQPDVTVVGPWRGAGNRALRPRPDRAQLLVRVERPFEEVSTEMVPRLRARVAASVRPPLRAHVTGFADIANGIHGGTVAALHRAELIAAPALVVVLLAVFRAPIPAGLTLLLGLMTIGAGRGVIDLLNRATELDAVALNLMSMMGLALGVDYSLLVVSRFREELAGGSDPRAALRAATATAGRTVRFAGLALGLAMVTALLIAPGSILVSAAAGTVVAVVLSVIAAGTALPAGLALLGAGIDRWRFGGRGEGGAGRVALRAVRHPAATGALALAVLAVLAVPALGLDTGAPDPRSLPADSRERQDFEAVRRVMGAGWASPYEIVVASDRGPVTDPRRLRALADWEQRIERLPEVEAVFGLGALSRPSVRLPDPSGLLAGAGRELEDGQARLAQLRAGLDRAGQGVALTRGGLELATRGAARLQDGAGQAAVGSAMLETGLRRARQGSERLAKGVSAALPAARSLAQGAGEANRGSQELQRGLDVTREAVRQAQPRAQLLVDALEEGARDLERLREPARISQQQLEKALDSLEDMRLTSKLDPEYPRLVRAVATALGAVSGRNPIDGDPVQPGYAGLADELKGAREGASTAAEGTADLRDGLDSLDDVLVQLQRGASELDRGTLALANGTEQLIAGIERLRRADGRLVAGLRTLEARTAELSAGVATLRTAAGRLKAGLRAGAGQTAGLVTGVGRLSRGAGDFAARSASLEQQLGTLTGAPPGADQLQRSLGSGYAVLAALDRAPEATRSLASFAVNLDRGGSAGRMLVVPARVTRSGGSGLRPELEAEARRLARSTGARVAVGGPAAVLDDYDRQTAGRLWLLVAALVAVTYLVLVVVFRSLLLPALAVALNVVTVAAAFGVLVLGFQGAAPLGGAGFLDAIMVTSIFAVVFGLSIDYEVFLITRMREEWVRGGTAQAAIAHGLRSTARVVTGAALIMTAVFVAFAFADISTMGQFGVGLTVAVLLDATIVRLVALPAAMRLLGDACWWLPGWLERRLPRPAT